MKELVYNEGNKSLTDSLRVAHKFGREHKTILRAIRNLKCSKEFTEHNFVPSTYTSAQGDNKPFYVLTKDGFTFLAMGFTGKLAAKFKEDYIKEFNLKDRQLRELLQPKPKTAAEILLDQSILLVEQEKKLIDHGNRIEQLEAKNTTRPNYYTIAGYGSLNHINVNIKTAGRLGRKASKICKDEGYEIDHCPDPRFGRVNTYPMEILDRVFNESL